jgi:hypothetical protein
MWKFIYLIMSIIPVLSHIQCAPDSNCVCDVETLSLLRKNNWIVVPWDNGQCYFHNTITREDADYLPWFGEEQK